MRSAWLLLMLWVPLSARAQPATALVWNAPEGCPTQAEVLAHCGGDCGEAQVTATVAREGARFGVVLQFSAPFAGERRLQVDHCAEAAQATAFFIRMVASPGAAIEAEVATPALAAAPSTPEPPLPRGFVLAQGQTHVVGLPSARLGGGLSAGLFVSRWRVALSLSSLAPLTIVGGPTRDASVWLQGAVLARLGLGFTFRLGPLAVVPALVGDVEWLRAAGLGVDDPRSVSTVRIAAGGSVSAMVTIWRSLFIAVEAAVAANLARPRMFFSGGGPDVAVVGPVEVDARVGVGATF